MGTTPYHPRVPLLVARLRNARIFDMGKDTYAQLYVGADIYTTEDIAKVKYTQRSEHVPEKDTKKHFKVVTEVGRSWPFPGASTTSRALLLYCEVRRFVMGKRPHGTSKLKQEGA